MKKLIEIQNELKAPKSQYNAFGKYKYRKCEDILEAVKPLLKKHDCELILSDSVNEVGGLIFIEATAIFKHKDEQLVVTAQAGVSERKGMDIAQSFGASSSYARKYALNGLFLIDDNQDADNESPKDESKPVTKKPNLKPNTAEWENVRKALGNGYTWNQVKEKYKVSVGHQAQMEKELNNPQIA